MEAVLAAALFFIGAGLAPVVYGRRWEFFLSTPRWMMRRLHGIIEKKPPVPALAAFIFGFNGLAMFLYMMTGVIPGAAYLIAGMTGLNVALAGLLSREEPMPRNAPAFMPVSVRVCMLLTFLLELPCFWFAMGMGFTMPHVIPFVQETDTAGILLRVRTYLVAILPILAVSASVEAYAVLWAARQERDE